MNGQSSVMIALKPVVGAIFGVSLGVTILSEPVGIGLDPLGFVIVATAITEIREV